MTFLITSDVTEELYSAMSYFLFSFIKKPDQRQYSVYIDLADNELLENRWKASSVQKFS